METQRREEFVEFISRSILKNMLLPNLKRMTSFLKRLGKLSNMETRITKELVKEDKKENTAAATHHQYFKGKMADEDDRFRSFLELYNLMHINHDLMMELGKELEDYRKVAIKDEQAR